MGELLSGRAGGQPSGEAQRSSRHDGMAADEARQLPDDIAFLAHSGLQRHALVQAAAIGQKKDIAASEVLIHRGAIVREDYEQRLAEEVGAIWRPEGPDPDLIDVAASASTDELRAVGAMECRSEGKRLFLSPQTGDYRRIAAMAALAPETFRGVFFTGQPTLKRALFESNRQGFARRAVGDLAGRLPHFSAARRLSSAQALVFGALALLVCFGLVLDPRAAFVSGAVFLSAFYFAIIVLRAILIVMLDLAGQGNRETHITRPRAPEDHPVYSVLVALKGEAGQVGALIAALDRLDWPKTKREIFLICEEDDPDTIQAIRRFALPEGFELLVCPPCAPYTKPKALDFALPLCSGRFIVIYDAEDRPHPRQLHEAWQKLEEGGENLACVQAPLLVHNIEQSWLTRLFAVEYRTQFLGTLPVLEALGAPLALGGTSNHFRTNLLRAAGGWDPYNVTEDADLGIRLARLGCRCGTISSPTWEEAPPVARVWLNQRTRWMKGWVQTMLVHSRNPLRTARELGLKGTILFHLTITAIVISMLIHPFFLALLGRELFDLAATGARGSDPLMLGISVFNLVGGYTTYTFLAHGVHLQSGARISRIWLMMLPAYWLMISLAGWRALFQLVFDPFRCGIR